MATVGTAALQWSASADTRVVGYRVYWGTRSRQYDQTLGQGARASAGTTSHVVTNLPTGRLYYFAVTAYDSAGNESAFSDEATKTIR